MARRLFQARRKPRWRLCTCRSVWRSVDCAVRGIPWRKSCCLRVGRLACRVRRSAISGCERRRRCREPAGVRGRLPLDQAAVFRPALLTPLRLPHRRRCTRLPRLSRRSRVRTRAFRRLGSVSASTPGRVRDRRRPLPESSSQNFLASLGTSLNIDGYGRCVNFLCRRDDKVLS